ncbi:hypothetical protein Poly51_53590 [Rubripirellula tenax]|uniref:Uncharacterized protein n=1 Tax=Rubripirellula tenax TaxID=2528015 RepID=A0A5C6EJV0_9BACT|nr:hypothetical protein Poly51_53590 [Rubripirellula tenax]
MESETAMDKFLAGWMQASTNMFLSLNRLSCIETYILGHVCSLGCDSIRYNRPNRILRARSTLLGCLR